MDMPLRKFYWKIHKYSPPPKAAWSKVVCRWKIQKDTRSKNWVFTVIDRVTRFVLAFDISKTKDKYGAISLFQAAKNLAGFSPKMLMTNKLTSFSTAFKKVFSSKINSAIHTCNIHIRGQLCDTNDRKGSTENLLVDSILVGDSNEKSHFSPVWSYCIIILFENIKAYGNTSAVRLTSWVMHSSCLFRYAVTTIVSLEIDFFVKFLDFGIEEKELQLA